MTSVASRENAKPREAGQAQPNQLAMPEFPDEIDRNGKPTKDQDGFTTTSVRHGTSPMLTAILPWFVPKRSAGHFVCSGRTIQRKTPGRSVGLGGG